MNQKLKRYDLIGKFGDSKSMREMDNGQYVLYSDYEKLQKQLGKAEDALKLRVKELENSIRVVRKAIAVGTWNINPEFARFSVEVSKLFEAQLKGGEL